MSRSTTQNRTAWFRRDRVGLLVFAVAMVAFFGSAFLPIARVAVQNDTDATLTELHLTGRCLDRVLPDLGPHEATTVWWRTCGETGLRLRFRQAGKRQDASDFAYVGTPPPHRSTVHVGEDGKVSDEFGTGWFLTFLP